MSTNLSQKLDDMQQSGDRHLETKLALSDIRLQLEQLTKSVETCQTEVSEVKRDMFAVRHELDTVQHVKNEIEELRDYVERIEQRSYRRKLRLLHQVGVGGKIFLTNSRVFPLKMSTILLSREGM